MAIVQAAILAAGRGTRLGELTSDKPKCMLKLNKVTILDYIVYLLSRFAGIRYEDIFVVAGYKADRLAYLKDRGINIVFNDKYNTRENMYSFYLLKDYVNRDFILVNGDTIFEPKVLETLVNQAKARPATYFVIDTGKKLGWEEMKVIIDKETMRIKRFGKDIPPDMADGEYIGLAYFKKEDAEIVFTKLDELVRAGRVNIWYELAINEVLDRIAAYALPIKDALWIEVDTKEDYENAKKIYKRIKQLYRLEL